MKKSPFYIISVGILAVASACETSLPVPDHQVSGDESVVISSLACAGDCLKVRLARTEAIGEAHHEVYEDKELLWRALMFPDTTYLSYPQDSLLMKKYKEQLVLGQSSVTLTTPTGEELPLKYNNATLDYECGYIPLPGERLTITAECQSGTAPAQVQRPHICTATVNVPDWKPEFEIVSAEKVYKKTLTRDDLNLAEPVPDSVIDFKIRIIDPSPQLHAYRIKVQGCAYSYQRVTDGKVDRAYINWIDAFFSNDPLLYDAGITDNFGPWQAYTTDVFTNQAFQGGEYYMSVQSRIHGHSSGTTNGRYRAVKITLQPIAPSLANYLSSLYRLRSMTPTYFTEPTSLSSNVVGGVGIFGAIGESTSIFYRFPGEEDPLYPEQ